MVLARVNLLAGKLLLADAREHLRLIGETLRALCHDLLVSAGIFFGVAFLLHVDEVRDVFDLVRRDDLVAD